MLCPLLPSTLSERDLAGCKEAQPLQSPPPSVVCSELVILKLPTSLFLFLLVGSAGCVHRVHQGHATSLLWFWFPSKLPHPKRKSPSCGEVGWGEALGRWSLESFENGLLPLGYLDQSQM